nr:hypothetical protein CFP56_55991 [Quercus suber]
MSSTQRLCSLVQVYTPSPIAPGGGSVLALREPPRDLAPPSIVKTGTTINASLFINHILYIFAPQSVEHLLSLHHSWPCPYWLPRCTPAPPYALYLASSLLPVGPSSAVHHPSHIGGHHVTDTARSVH